MIVDGWLDWAVRVPGPADKRYSQPNAALGYVPHSAVGFYPGWEARLFSSERDPQDPSRYSRYAAASVHGWIAYDGSVIQHYPFTVSCWASGNRHANTTFVAFENEGGPPWNVGEPLTPEQVATNALIIRELSRWRSWTPRRPGVGGRCRRDALRTQRVRPVLGRQRDRLPIEPHSLARRPAAAKG